MDDIEEELSRFHWLDNIADQFVLGFQNAILDAYEARYEWKGWEKAPLEIEKIIREIVTRYDFEATILLHFDGRELTKKIDWKQDLQNAREQDKKYREKWNRFLEEISKTGIIRKSWITNFLLAKLVKFHRGIQDLLLEISAPPSDSALMLIESFIEKLPALPEETNELFSDILLHNIGVGGVHPIKEEVKAVLKELEQEKIVERFPFKINETKAEKKASEAINVVLQETGYPLLGQLTP